MIEPNKPYKFIYKTNAEEELILTFTEDNLIYPNEIYKDFDSYECYNNSRFVFYIDSIHNKYCCLKTDEDPNDGKEYWFNITKIYLDDKLIFTNSFHYINMYKKLK